MTPHPHPSPSRRVHRRTPAARHARRIAAVSAIVLAAGAPLVAHASSNAADTTATFVPPVARIAPLVPAPDADLATPRQRGLLDDAGAATTAPRIAPPTVDPSLGVLVDTYAWDERSSRVEALQSLIGSTVDGWYGTATRHAHLTALDGLGFPTDTVPVPPLPPGPSPEAWAALRDCESNGNYAITNPSGKYRGAYQFDRSTWNSVASRHDPSLVGADPAAASPADQDAMASALYIERGARPWPHCGRHLR